MTVINIQASVQVNDAGDEPRDIQFWIDLLAKDVHNAAERQYSKRRGCAYRAFTKDATPRILVNGRQAFADFMDSINFPPEHIAKHLREWDGQIRPVAIIHWFKADDA